MPAIGRPVPIPFMFRFFIGSRLMKLVRILDIHADATVSMHMLKEEKFI
jgi:hypothetical protein